MGYLAVGAVVPVMRRLAVLAVFSLCIAGCNKTPKADSAPALPASPSDSSSVCWAPSIKLSVQQSVVRIIGETLDAFKGQMPQLDDVITAPRDLEFGDFGIRSQDDKTGHTVCETPLTATFKTKNLGTIEVSQAIITFDVVRTEKGYVASVADSDLNAFWDPFFGQLRNFGIYITNENEPAHQ